MTLLRVGSRYHPAKSSWPEGVHVLGLSAERMEVMVSLAGVTDEEVQAFSAAGGSPIDVGLATHGSLVLLLVRIPGVLEWTDAVYDARLLPAEQQTLPAIAHTAVTWLLVDAATGVLRGLRLATLSPSFLGVLREKLEAQAARPFDRARYDADAVAYQARFTAEQLVQRAWIVEQAGLSEQPSEALRDVHAEIRETLPLDRLIQDERIREVVVGAIARGDAHVESRAGTWWYVDPGFGDDVPLDLLGYDDKMGMVDRRRFPAAPRA